VDHVVPMNKISVDKSLSIWSDAKPGVISTPCFTSAFRSLLGQCLKISLSSIMSNESNFTRQTIRYLGHIVCVGVSQIFGNNISNFDFGNLDF